jgi:nitroreductase
MHDNEILRIIKQRRSIRQYQEKQISDDELNVLLESAVYAPSGSGQIEDFIHFTVIQNKATMDRINNLAKEFARQSGIDYLIELGNNKEFNCLYGAPTFIIISYNENWVQPETDCAAATENMLLAAESMGLGGCWLYFPLQAFNTAHGKKLLEELKIPEGHKPITSLITGYKAGEEPAMPKRVAKNISRIK